MRHIVNLLAKMGSGDARLHSCEFLMMFTIIAGGTYRTFPNTPHARATLCQVLQI